MKFYKLYLDFTRTNCFKLHKITTNLDDLLIVVKAALNQNIEVRIDIELDM